VTRYIYDTEDILLELDGSNNVVARYTHGPGIDEPLIMEKAGASFFYQADGLGSITELTDSAGVVKQSYTYSSFGKIESQLDPTFIQPYTFTAREFDTETGLYFYRARYYDPSIGRFLSEDPAGSLSDLNFYAYVRNNPAKFTDPTGLIVSQLLMRGVNTILRNPRIAEEIGVQAQVLDSVIGVGALAAGLQISPSVRETAIPGLGGFTIGNAVDGLTLYDGVRTVGLGAGIASTTVGLSTTVGYSYSQCSLSRGGCWCAYAFGEFRNRNRC
jgi:RHS repeat-associated protein